VSAPWGRPAPYAGAFSQGVHWICGAFLAATGWTLEGNWPVEKKVVLVCAPHTSNWDGLWMLAAAGYYRARLRWMGKESLTRGPFGGLIKWLGCVPIDRSARNDVVTAMSNAFAAEESMYLAIPPEGTRSLAREWKSGFYHIARMAKVPILVCVLDYATHTIRLAALFEPTGDYPKDLAEIQSHYATAVAKHQAKFAAGG